MKKTAKFGGSSVASASQIKKVGQIIKDDKDIRAIVVSAPGKRFKADIKVTDLLISLFEEYKSQSPSYIKTLNMIILRYTEISEVLGLDKTLVNSFKEILLGFLTTIKDEYYLENAIKSSGEDFNARLIAAYLKKIGLRAKYVSPKDLGIVLEYSLEDVHILNKTYENISKFKDSEDILVIPGFYGYSQEGNRLTFSRGGSDITGAIVARGLSCDIYENYTDMTYIYSANPSLFENPAPIKNISYAEMRELSYNGFEIFQEDAVEPLLDTNIEIHVKNTNKPTEGGTIISQTRSDVDKNPIIGMSDVGDFTSFKLTEYLMNRKVGYIKNVLDIFQYMHIPVEHIPTSIDSVSILVRSEYMGDSSKKSSIVNAINNSFDLDELVMDDSLKSIAIVGEGLRNQMTKALYLISEVLNTNNIKIEYIIQGASNNSLFILINKKDEEICLRSLYRAIYEDKLLEK